MIPKFSILVEGYNDSLQLGSAMESLEHLAHQDFDLAAVEVVLTGSAEQVEIWLPALESRSWPFSSVQAVPAPKAHYYQLKNIAADVATGEILVFIDSDVLPLPGWLQAIAKAFKDGAQASAGLSLFYDPEGKTPSIILDAAAAISWGFIVGEHDASAFLSHNFAIRADCFRLAGAYREDFGRTLAGSFLLERLQSMGIPIHWNANQAVAHTWDFRWWVTRLHVRFGHEVYLMHRERKHASGLLRHLGPLAPLLTAAWHFALDIRNWFRIEQRRQLPLWRRFLYLPLLCALSVCARCGELAGMYATAWEPVRMRRFAARN